MRETGPNNGSAATMVRQQDSEVPSMIGRRSTRLEIKIPVKVTGKDASGRPFKEIMRTLTVNKHGAKLATYRRLEVGDIITLENPALGQTAKARVHQVSENCSANNLIEVCVELIEAQNIWGVKFPPLDWQGNGSNLVRNNGRGAATKKGLAEHGGESADPAPPRPAETLQGSNRIPSTEGDGADLEETRADVAGRLRIKPNAEEVPQSQAGIQTTLNRLEEKEGTVRILEQHLDTMKDFLRASRTELEELLSKFQELQRTCQFETQKMQDKLQQANGDALQPALEELNRRLNKELEVTSIHLVNEIRARVTAEVSAALGSLDQATSERPPAVIDEPFQQLAHDNQNGQKEVIEQTRAQIAHVVENESARFAETIKKTADGMVPLLRQEIERSLEQSAQQITSRQSNFFREQVHAAALGAQRSAHDNLKTISTQIQQEAARAAGEAKQLLHERVDQLGEILAQQAHDAAAAINCVGEKEGERLRESQEELRLKLKTASEELQIHLENCSNAFLGQFESKAHSLLGGFQTEMREHLEDQREEIPRAALEYVEKTIERELEATVKQIHSDGDDTRAWLDEELRTTARGLREEMERQLHVKAHELLQALGLGAQTTARELEDRLSGNPRSLEQKSEQLTASMSKFVEGAHEQLAAMTRAASQVFTHEAEATSGQLEALRGQLTGLIPGKIDELKQRLDELTQSAVTSLTDKAEAVEKRTEMLKASSSAVMREVEEQIMGMTSASVELLSKHAQTLVERYRGELQQMHRRLQGNSARDLENSVRPEIQRNREALPLEVREDTQLARKGAMAEFKIRIEQITKEASDTLLQELGTGTLALEDRAGNAGSCLEAYIQLPAETFRRRVDELSQAAMATHRQESADLMDGLHKLLADGARVFARDTSEWQ